MKNKKLWLSVPSVAMAITVALSQPSVALAMEEAETQEVTETQEVSEESASAVVIVVQGTDSTNAEDETEDEEAAESDQVYADTDVEDTDDTDDTDVDDTDVDDTDVDDTDVDDTDDTDTDDTDVDDTDDTDVDDTDDTDTDDTDTDDTDVDDTQDEEPAPGYPDGPDNTVADDIVDAEKYGEAGYDSNLCWAASAADVLWQAGYPQNAINPLTNEVFQSEDEVFDYFRACFTDEGSNQVGALSYFIDGYYPYDGMEGFSQLKVDAPQGGLVPEINSDDVTVYLSDSGDLSTNIFADYETLLAEYGGAASLAVSFWDQSEEKYLSGHAITLVSLEKDEVGNYVGIWFVDSDNDKLVEWEDLSDEEKAQIAATAPNSCQYYTLSAKDIDNGLYWVIDDYSGYETVIDSLVYLAQYNPELFAQIYDEVIGGGSGSGAPSNSITEEAFAAIRNMMVDAGWAIYSPSNTIYDATKDTGYSVFVAGPTSELLNVYVDGQRLSAGAGEYKLYMSPSGVFSLTIDTAIMRSLASGEHTLTLDMNSGEDIVSTINVQ